MRVIFIAYRFHLYHVFPTDRLISTFVKQDTRIVTIINDGITHQFSPLSPLASFTVFFCITGLHCLDQPYAVTRFNVLFPWSDMHPANQVGIIFHHQSIAIVTQPCRNAHSYSRPFIAGTLGKPLHLDYAIIQPYHTFPKASFAETCPGSYFIYLFTVCP